MTDTQIAPWTISVISTDYDLQPVRKALLSMLRRFGFRVMAFESPDFPVDPKIHSHDACLTAIQQSDIVVLVLNERYGGWYINDKRRHPRSITHMEYLEAKRLGKIIIPCVHRSLEKDRFRVNKSAKAAISPGASKEELQEAIRAQTPGYAKSPELLIFLEELRKADTDNFICYYETTAEILREVRGRLQGLSRYICQDILTQQIECVSRMSTAAIATQSIADVISGGLFVEPPFKGRKSAYPKSKSPLSSLLSISVRQRKQALIIGGAGRGKSILLIREFLRTAKQAIRARSKQLPFYFSLRGLGRHVSLNVMELMDGIFRDTGRPPYPALDMRNVDPIFFIDGIDELDPQCSSHDLNRLARDGALGKAAVACMRSDVFERMANVQGEFADSFSGIYELQEWTPDHSAALAENFCALRGRPDISPQLQTFIKSEEGAFLNSPLLVTLFFYIFAESGLSIPPDLQGEIDVFRLYLTRLAGREVFRMDIPTEKRSETESALTLAWSWGAWEVYRQRMAGARPRLPEVVAAAKAHLPDHDQAITETPAFTALFDIMPHTLEVAGTVHERFMEYIISSLFVDCCSTGQREVVGEYLVLPIRFKMNAFIKAMWARTEATTVSRSMEYLWELFQDGMSLPPGRRTPHLSNALYYLSYGLNPLPVIAKQRLRQAADIAKSETYVKNSALFGLVRLGDMIAERELYASLSTDPEADQLNRGAHLVYFRDWLASDPPPFIDDGECGWENSYEGLLSHVMSEDKRFVHSKRIDLFTIRSFLQSRGMRYPITRSHLDAMANALERNAVVWNDYTYLFELAREELRLLCVEWEHCAI